MGKVINSRAILNMAKNKAKEQRLYFDPHEELKDKSVIEQMLYFCFLNIECLFKDKQISKETKNYYITEFEKKSQDFAELIYPMQKIYDELERNLQSALRNKDYESAVEYLASMLDYSRQQIFEGKYTVMCNAFFEENNPIPED